MILFGSGSDFEGRLQIRATRIRNDFFSDPNPVPAKCFGSDRIRIHNWFGVTIEEQGEGGEKFSVVDPHWFQCGQGAKPMRIQKLFLVAVNKVYLLINVNLHVLDPNPDLNSQFGSGSGSRTAKSMRIRIHNKINIDTGQDCGSGVGFAGSRIYSKPKPGLYHF